MQVTATEFPTQGLQRREQRSISLPSEAPDLQALLAPDSPLGAAAAANMTPRGHNTRCAICPRTLAEDMLRWQRVIGASFRVGGLCVFAEDGGKRWRCTAGCPLRS